MDLHHVLGVETYTKVRYHWPWFWPDALMVYGINLLYLIVNNSWLWYKTLYAITSYWHQINYLAVKFCHKSTAHNVALTLFTMLYEYAVSARDETYIKNRSAWPRPWYSLFYNTHVCLRHYSCYCFHQNIN